MKWSAKGQSWIVKSRSEKNTNLGMGKFLEALGLNTQTNGLRAENQLSNKVVLGPSLSAAG